MRSGRAASRRFPGGLAAIAASGACALLLTFAAPLAAQAPSDSGPSIPRPAGYVVDRADVIDDATQEKLEAFLDQLEKKTGVEFAVLTVPTTAPLDPIQYKTQVYQQWGGHREGLLMLVAIQERTIAFETGYEVEGTLPDGLQARIIRDEMVPRFRAGDVTGGIVAGVLDCAGRIAKEKGVTVEWDSGRPLRAPPERKRMPMWLVLLIFIGIMTMLSGRRGYRRGGWWIGPGMGGLGGWGGGGGGGGGFGSGGSFGGFGGGFGSGGGGGSGRW